MSMVIDRLGKRFKYREIFRTLGINRSAYYARKKKKTQAPKKEDAFVEAVKKIALQKPCYGYRRVAQVLMAGQGKAHYKKVYMIMKTAGLLCKRKKRWVKTTNSVHSLPVFLE